jgi:hypothetical protein
MVELELALALEQETKSDKRSGHGQRGERRDGETQRRREGEGHEPRLSRAKPKAKAHPSASWLKCG